MHFAGLGGLASQGQQAAMQGPCQAWLCSEQPRRAVFSAGTGVGFLQRPCLSPAHRHLSGPAWLTLCALLVRLTPPFLAVV